jgi:hypothetical protein
MDIGIPRGVPMLLLWWLLLGGDKPIKICDKARINEKILYLRTDIHKISYKLCNTDSSKWVLPYPWSAWLTPVTISHRLSLRPTGLTQKGPR